MEVTYSFELHAPDRARLGVSNRLVVAFVRCLGRRMATDAQDVASSRPAKTKPGRARLWPVAAVVGAVWSCCA